MNMEEQLRATVNRAELDGTLWHTIIHGSDTTVVPTEGGGVPTVAKQLKDVRNEIINGLEDYVGNCRTLKEETLQIKTQADAIKTATNTIKNQTAEIKTEVEIIKSETEDLKRAAEIAVSYTSGPNLFDFKWADHKLNDISWLRADTFSWQSGDVYTTAYQHLVDDLDTATLKADGLVDWVQPVLTANSTVTPLGTVTASAGSTYSGYDAYKAMDGVKTGTTATTGWGTNNTSAVSWWQIKFPYKLKITGLKGYQRYDGTKANANTVGRFYTSSAKTTPIGNEYNNAVSLDWNEVEVTGIPAEGIITDTIYFEKTGGGNYGGLGELEITAQRLTQDVPIYYYEALDGHKITTDETAAAQIFNLFDVSWYYILDTVNHRFKLPRTKYGFVSLRNKVGDFIPESLPNITGRFTNENPATAEGCFYKTDGNRLNGRNGNDNYNDYNYFDASRSSPAYQNGAPVQQRATQMYLYFYVGNFSKEAVVQTAGITTETMNEKADRDWGNLIVPNNMAQKLNNNNIRTVVESYKNGTDWYRVWSDGWIEQGGHSGSSGGQTITFPKPFTTTDYTVTSCGTIFYTGTEKTTTTFKCSGNAWGTATVAYLDWYACGF